MITNSPCLILAGGNALGAYQLGAWAALDAAGIVPGWIVGTSIGGVNAALIAGNPPGQRTAALQRFWDQARSFDVTAPWQPPALRQSLEYGQALSSRLFGGPLYTTRLPNLTGQDHRPSLLDVAPLRALIARMVDFDRLNGGAIRVSLTAVDLASGEQVCFDTARERIGLDHVLASAALPPDFAPVDIGGRLFADGGLAANLPLHVVLDEALDATDPDPAARLTCFAVDLFPLAAPLPQSVLQATQRLADLAFASQTSRTLHTQSRLWRRRVPGAEIFLATYDAVGETAIKGYDFSAGILSHRQRTGHADMRQLLSQRSALAGQSPLPGLSVYTPPTPPGQPSSDRNSA